MLGKRYYLWILLLAASLLSGQSSAVSIVKAIEDSEVEIELLLTVTDDDDGELILISYLALELHSFSVTETKVPGAIFSGVHPAYLHGIRAPPQTTPA